MAKVDSRHRIALGRAASPGASFTVYRNRRGQVFLEPVASETPVASLAPEVEPTLTAARLSLAEHHAIGCFGPDSLAE